MDLPTLSEKKSDGYQPTKNPPEWDLGARYWLTLLFFHFPTLPNESSPTLHFEKPGYFLVQLKRLITPLPSSESLGPSS